jgi:ATP-dependent DNA helicase PIF1
VNIILVGDLFQLKPVFGHYIFHQPTYVTELNLWRKFEMFELLENMRQRGDHVFIDILNNLRVGKITPDQFVLLKSRLRKEEELTSEFEDKSSMRIVATVAAATAHNQKVLKSLSSKTNKFYTFKALDRLVDESNFEKDVNKYIPTNENQTAGVPGVVELAVGAKVMLRYNVSVSEGLVNGSLGTVISIKWKHFRRDQISIGELPEYVEVEFDGGVGLKRIRPVQVNFDGLHASGKIERSQIPLILAWAVTAHKLQGATVKKAVIDMGSSVFAKGMPYVMLSRVESLEKLVFIDLKLSKLSMAYVDHNVLQEMERLRNVPAKK